MAIRPAHHSRASTNEKRFGHCRLADLLARTDVALFIPRAVDLTTRLGDFVPRSWSGL